MKKLFIILLCSLYLTIFSQSSIYKPFCDNPSWTVVSTNFGLTGYDTYQYQSDTVIGVFTYKKIKEMNSPFKYVFFREDISQKKIYQYDITNSIDYLYVDFSLNIGDPFTLRVNGMILSTTVIFKDSVLINGCYHNAMSFSENSGFTGYRFTEGILSPKDPLNPYYWGGDPYVQLVCECHNGQSYYFENGGSFNNFSCFLSCSPATVCSISNSLIEFTNYGKPWNIYPNPGNVSIFIKSEINLNTESYLMFDYTGKEVLSNVYSAEKGIEIKSLAPGIYTLKIKNSFLKFIKID